jgi:hypothetical protein
MAAANFERTLALALVHEGGYVDHSADPGGATNLGIAIGTLLGWLGRQAAKAEVRALTNATVAPIYRKNYWDAVRADDLPSGVDYCVFDFALNSGPCTRRDWAKTTRQPSLRMTRSMVQPGREEDRIIPLVNQPVPSPPPQPFHARCGEPLSRGKSSCHRMDRASRLPRPPFGEIVRNSKFFRRNHGSNCLHSGQLSSIDLGCPIAHAIIIGHSSMHNLINLFYKFGGIPI